MNVDHSSPSSPLLPGGSPRVALLIVAVSAVLVAQLVPVRIDRGPAAPSPIASVVAVPPDVDAILRRSCYDCHSGSTVVPWYGAIQPVGGWIAGHVQEGRRELNFEAFGTYRPRRQYVKLAQIEREVGSGAMPLPSYLWMHANADLSAADRALLAGWVGTARAELERRYPPDSLQRRR